MSDMMKIILLLNRKYRSMLSQKRVACIIRCMLKLCALEGKTKQEVVDL